MSGTNSNPLAHFGRQVRKERTARGWTLPEMGRRTGIDAGHWSRIERGVRPPTEKVAEVCDRVFPERQGWFGEYFRDSRGWAPPGFRSWAEEEDTASSLRVWCPSVIHGLLQTEDYARALLSVDPDAAGEVVTTRLAGRMARQKRLFARDVRIWFLVDQLSLYRLVGSTEVMAAQLRHLAEMSARPKVTIQVVPAVAMPGGASGAMLTDGAAYAETLVSGSVWTDEETLSSLSLIFDSLRGESWRVSESLALIEEAGELWTGGSLHTQTAETPTA